MSPTLYVEGGGHRQLDAELRKAFHDFLGAAGVNARPRVVAGGSRQATHRAFYQALMRSEAAYLLVDAEATPEAELATGDPANWQPWAHLLTQDQWQRPDGATDQQCHLMVECMENWLLADPTMLAEYFGKGFQAQHLPKPGASVESLTKQQAQHGLVKATRQCASKGAYSKGAHSFKLLALLSPAKLLPLAPWAQRFVQTLR